jgi:pimeloyl-ACP methyl ester carboxylesterase
MLRNKILVVSNDRQMNTASVQTTCTYMKFSFASKIAKAILVASILGTASLAPVANAAVGVFPASTFNNLDHGLYWFGNADSWQKAVPNSYNAYYNASKPTIIYIHGWQNGSSQALNRETFNRKDAGGPDLDLAYAWRQAGYNVGIMYWNQFSDEGEVKDAEAKIWTASGTRAMRWRNASGVYSNGPTQSVGDLMFQSYKDNMAGYTGGNIRIAGHSLGNQLAIVLAEKISDAVSAGTLNSNLLPKRVALLDPFYSQDAKTYLGNKWTGEVCREYVTNLKTKGVIFEAYRTSLASSSGFIGDTNTGLMNMTAFTELKTSYFNQTQQTQKHNAAVWHYLWSFGSNPPVLTNTTTEAASAKTSDSRINTLMGGTKKLVQDRGNTTKEPWDDTFLEYNR